MAEEKEEKKLDYCLSPLYALESSAGETELLGSPSFPKMNPGSLDPCILHLTICGHGGYRGRNVTVFSLRTPSSRSSVETDPPTAAHGLKIAIVAKKVMASLRLQSHGKVARDIRSSHMLSLLHLGFIARAITTSPVSRRGEQGREVGAWRSDLVCVSIRSPCLTWFGWLIQGNQGKYSPVTVLL